MAYTALSMQVQTLPINQAGEETVCNLEVLKIGCNFATKTKFTESKYIRGFKL